MPCTKVDCIYRNENRELGNCNYHSITGQTKLGQLKRKENYDVENCQFYKQGRKLKPAISQPFVRSNPIEVVKAAQKIDSMKALELYDLRLSDEDMAMFLDTIPNAIAKWRMARGLLRPQGIPQKEIEWCDITEKINEGYTDEALAEYFKLDVRVIQIYRDYLKDA